MPEFSVISCETEQTFKLFVDAIVHTKSIKLVWPVIFLYMLSVFYDDICCCLEVGNLGENVLGNCSIVTRIFLWLLLFVLCCLVKLKDILPAFLQ